MSGNSRVFGLDLLRAFAILCVVYGHGYYLIKWTPAASVIPETIYNLPVFDGVSIFFVLSGFLIGRILLRTVAKEGFNGQMLLEFWVRRWFRTLPNYMLVLTFVAISAFLLAKPEPPEDLVLYFSFTQNIASPHPEFFPEAWSLAVEEWFYLFIPVPLYLSRKLRNIDRRNIMIFWITLVIVLTTAFRFYRVYYFGDSESFDWGLDIKKQVITRLDSLMFGVLGAYASIYHKDIWNKLSSPALVVGIGLLLLNKLILINFHSIFYKNYFTLSITAVGTLLLLPKLSVWKIEGGGMARVVTFLSLTSYSMYLLNYTPVQGIVLPIVMKEVMHYLWRLDEYRVLISYFLYWFITIVGSFLVYRFFENPMTKLRDKWPLHGHQLVKAFVNYGVQGKSTRKSSK